MTATATTPQVEVTLAHAGDNIVLVLTSPTDGALGVSMSPREADKLAGRLRKAANDARSATARKAAA
jgi:hypothetical protein